MKKLKIILLSAGIVGLGITAYAFTTTDSCGTCTGSKSCSACKNCKYCKHCKKDGGTCGVCK